MNECSLCFLTAEGGGNEQREDIAAYGASCCLDETWFEEGILCESLPIPSNMDGDEKAIFVDIICRYYFPLILNRMLGTANQ